MNCIPWVTCLWCYIHSTWWKVVLSPPADMGIDSPLNSSQILHWIHQGFTTEFTTDSTLNVPQIHYWIHHRFTTEFTADSPLNVPQIHNLIHHRFNTEFTKDSPVLLLCCFFAFVVWRWEMGVEFTGYRHDIRRSWRLYSSHIHVNFYRESGIM